jgi:membrane fusion protein
MTASTPPTTPPDSTGPPARKLFRDEAVAHQQEKFWGEVLVTRPLALTLLTWCAIAFAAALAAYLTWGEYTRKVKVSGYLQPLVGVVRVAASQQGVLKMLLEEGQLVKAGDVIATVELERDPGGDARQSALRKEIEQRRASLNDERIRLDTALAEQGRQSATRETTIKSEMAALANEMNAKTAQFEALSSVADRHEKLFKEGFIGPNLVEQKRADALEQRTKLEALRRTRVQLLKDLQTAQGEQRTLAIRVQGQRGEIDRQLSSLDRERVDTDDRQREIAIVAPIDGTIATRAVTRGQSVASGAALLTLLPARNELQAELLVPTRAAGFVKPGQMVALRYQAFPFERFGHAQGTVKEVGQSVLTQGETGPLTLTEPVYRVVVSLADQTVSAYGQAMNLRAGMLLDADIQLEKRKLYEWLVEPIFAALGRA